MPRGRKLEPKDPDWPQERTLRLLKQQLDELQKFRGRSWREVDREEEEWQQFTSGVIIHGFGGESENLGNYNMARWAGVHNMMGISDHQRQLNFQERIEKFQAVLKSSIRELEAELPEPEVRTAAAVQGPAPAESPARTNLLVLISHSSKDALLAGELTEFVRAGLALQSAQIRCSSVDGYRLPAGVKTDDQLRIEVIDAKVLIGLITRNSLASPYVLFELGARWGAGFFMVPLLAGVTPEEVRGPLSGLNALSCSVEAQLHQMLAEMSQRLGVPLQSAASYLRYLKSVKETADALKDSQIQRLVQAASQPKMKPEIRMQAEDGWTGLDREDREAIRLLCKFGDMTDVNARERLHIKRGNLYHGIEKKTNFVLRTVQGQQINEREFGYTGTWALNPVFKDALEEIIEREGQDKSQERNRERVRTHLHDFTKEEKTILLRIIDDGGIPNQTMMNTSEWKPELIVKTIDKAKKHGLMEIAPGYGPEQIVPSLKDALQFVIENEDL